ncbi:hypothetical protein [Crateriforma conspicua]|uniref:hypothetical protein n=1 Tax=Crateriforma conspicua TaxID=2527996 RepID=UPI00118C5297|nr:hypothetical protein [Crateriforma conspicua]QDV61057.1 hypothetical protein Mal65_01800 [Crateriforma conspicua]
MTETEMSALRESQFLAFTDPRCRSAVANWQKVLERTPNGWLLYRVGNDKAVGHTDDPNWQDEPWTVVHGLSTEDPYDQAYCPTLQDAVDELLNG